MVFHNVALIFQKLRGNRTEGDFENTLGTLKLGLSARCSKSQSLPLPPRIVLDFYYHIDFTNSLNLGFEFLLSFVALCVQISSSS